MDAVNGSAVAKPPVSADWVYNELVTNRMTPQSALAVALYGRGAAMAGNYIDPPERDLDGECGYPTNPTKEYYWQLYERVGVAFRTVTIWPDECWAAYPWLYETERSVRTRFERAWEALTRKCNPWHFLHRADRLSRAGEFGTLFLGLDDGRDFRQPAEGVDPNTGEPLEGRRDLNLLYLRAFPQIAVNVQEMEGRRGNPRYGQPAVYSVDFTNPHGDDTNGPADATTRTEVHWTRMIHLADNRDGSEIYGAPACRPVLNNIHDIRKVSGGSSEMFWKGGFPGLSFETWPDVTGSEVDEDSIRDTVKAYQNGLQRYLTAVRGKWVSMAPQVADPEPNLTQQLNLLCSTIGVPLRIFLGTESGHLASTQDAGTWKERLRGRQLNYLEPMVVRPFVDRLIALGCLPPVKEYIINWRDLRALSDKDMADVGLKRVQAMLQYTTGGVFELIPPHMLFTFLLGFTDDQADAIITEMGGEEKITGALRKAAKPAVAAPRGGGRNGGAGRAPAGRPRGGPPAGRGAAGG